MGPTCTVPPNGCAGLEIPVERITERTKPGFLSAPVDTGEPIRVEKPVNGTEVVWNEDSNPAENIAADVTSGGDRDAVIDSGDFFSGLQSSLEDRGREKGSSRVRILRAGVCYPERHSTLCTGLTFSS